MIIKDVMPSFELFQPTQLRDAFALLGRFGKDSWKMAGGYDSLSWFKERAKKPKAVIDLSNIAEMKGVGEPADPQCRHHRGQCLPGCALLVLPRRAALLSGRRQHLLCRHSAGRQPRA